MWDTSGGEGRRPRLTPAMADVRRALREWATEQNLPPGQLVLVALSGGGDSTAAAWASALELPKLSLRVGAIIVDHQLQKDSSDVARRTSQQATDLGLSPVLIKQVEVGVDGGPEDAARTARYRAFAEVAKETGAAAILLAHTQDDQAETVLLGLARGSGPGSLKGMAQQDGLLHRPLLTLPRQSLRQALEDAGVEWWEDPHNEDDRFSRVRTRKSILPLMESTIGPGVATALARTAELFREDSSALDEIAGQLMAEHVTWGGKHHATIPVEFLARQPAAIRSRILRIVALRVGGIAPNYAQMQQISALITQWRGQAAVALSGASVVREDGLLHIRHTPLGDSEG